MSCLIFNESNTLFIIYRIFNLCMRFSRYVMFARLLVSRNGDGEIRTLDPLLARQVLSQLSYTPIPGNMKFSDRPLLRSMGLSGPYLLDSDYPKQM